MRRPLCSLMLLPLMLAACSKDGEGTSISVKDEGGNTVAAADGDNGQIKVNVPGFTGEFKLPKIKLDASNLDLNGVHLYPGTTIQSFNIDAGSGGGVRVGFTSPAAPATVRDWLAERLNKAEFRVRPDGNGLTGTTNENKPFRLTLDPAGADRATGELTIG